MPHSKHKFGDTREDGYRYIGRRFSRLKKMERMVRIGEVQKDLKNKYKIIKKIKKEFMILLVNQ